VRIGLNDLKTMISISVIKNAPEYSERPAALEEDELRKDGKKFWKTIEGTSINL